MIARHQGITLEEYLENTRKGLKRCMKCKTWKPTTEYPCDKSRKDGLHTKCFQCNRINRPPQWHILTKEEKERLKKRNQQNKWRKGVPLSKEHKDLLRRKRLEEHAKGIGSFSGPNNPNWNGGITSENQILRNSSQYHQWRNAVFERDKYICVKCGYSKGSILEAHHIKTWKEYPELRYDIDNGITVCRTCHAAIHDKPDSYRKRRKQKRTPRS